MDFGVGFADQHLMTCKSETKKKKKNETNGNDANSKSITSSQTNNSNTRTVVQETVVLEAVGAPDRAEPVCVLHCSLGLSPLGHGTCQFVGMLLLQHGTRLAGSLESAERVGVDGRGHGVVVEAVRAKVLQESAGIGTGRQLASEGSFHSGGIAGEQLANGLEHHGASGSGSGENVEERKGKGRVGLVGRGVVKDWGGGLGGGGKPRQKQKKQNEKQTQTIQTVKGKR